MPTPEQLFSDALRAEPSRPFVTYYDETTDERSELSVRSLANWVAKTYHLLTDELDLGVGDRALLALPAHWISIPIALGCFCAGVEIVTSGDAHVAFVEPSSVDAAGEIEERYAIAPMSAAVGLRGAEPAGTHDYVLAVRPQPDMWAGVQFGAGPEDAGLNGRTRAELGSHTADLPPGARLLSRGSAWLDDLLAVLAVGGSLVYVVGTDDAAVLDRRAEQERVTNRN